MNIQLNEYLVAGKNKRCQDYIVSDMNPFPHIVLADGCSASIRSESGAMVLSQIAHKKIDLIKRMYKQLSIAEIGRMIILLGETAMNSLGLHETSLDSTLIISWYDEEEKKVIVLMFGDGNIIHSIPKTNYKLYDTVFESKHTPPKSMPPYLSYHLNPKRLKAWISNGIGKTTSVTYSVEKFSEIKHNYKNPHLFINGESFQIHIKNDEDIMITSDGLSNFSIIGRNDIISPQIMTDNIWTLKGGKNPLEKKMRFLFDDGIEMEEDKRIKVQNLDDFSIGLYRFREDR